jgi:two-component system CheB/CheR fusion protein
VNSELKTRVDELSCANSDLVNLLECTQIAMFVADSDFALKSFTTAAKDLFHFVETDVGRPVSHIRARLRLDNKPRGAISTIVGIPERKKPEAG